MENDLKIRPNNFAHDCVRVALLFSDNKLGSHLKGQLIRCSASVTANYRAACLAQSKKSFISKLIVIEEVDEANYWLEFAKIEIIISSNELMDRLISEFKEFMAVFISSRKTTKEDKR
ncbi:MAG: four helix bundle protein [Bacteroidetes bacterium]|nr:four helix bundle protein [Bacteroidota bacterium]